MGRRRGIEGERATTMKRDATLSEVCALIALLPKTRVIESGWLEGRARIAVQATGDSANALNHETWTANVQMGSDTQHPDHYTIIASAMPRGVLDHGELQILGIHLVWHLLKADALPRDNGIRLLSAWRRAVP
jgi:hypothetical protein